ncbi:MAG: hypothetical protein ACXADL_03570 [Candidatus Thorarchaeota archaeon]
MDPMQSGFLLSLFVGGLLLLLFGFSKTPFSSTTRKLRKSQSAIWSLTEFKKMRTGALDPKHLYLFSEEHVTSMGHRFNGRFDFAVLRSAEAPILEIMIERKFPTKIQPDKAREEDVFQAELYTLALMESGVSCSSSRIVILYCLQDNAMNCSSQREIRECLSCSKVCKFETKFNQKKVLRVLGKLDEVWYNSRKPRASPSVSKCRACPYGKQHICQFTAR